MTLKTAFIGAVASACLLGAAQANAEEIVIGAAIAKTGWMAPYDTPVMDGFVLAAAEINANGGIGGKYEIRIVIKDNRSDSAQNSIITQELIDEGIDFMIATCDSSMVHAVAAILVEAQMPTISSCSSSPTLPLLGEGFIFANAPADNAQGTVLAQYARAQGYERAYLLKSPDMEYTLMPDYFGSVFEALGGTVIGASSYSVGQPDFSTEVTKIGALDPATDVIMTAAFEPDFPAFIRQLRAAGLEIPVVVGDGIDSPTTFALGEIVDGVVFTTAGFVKPGTPMGDFTERFEAHYGRPSQTIIDAVGYDLAKIINAAVAKADSLEGVDIRAALAELETVNGVTGDITFQGTNGTPLRPITLVRIQDGGREFVSQTIPDVALIPAPKF